jgi:hypothetical protein
MYVFIELCYFNTYTNYNVLQLTSVWKENGFTKEIEVWKENKICKKYNYVINYEKCMHVIWESGG